MVSPIRTPDHVLRTMALTMRDPSHPDAYRSSCHALTAHALRSGQLLPEHEIVLLGLRGEVLHSIITAGDEVLVDSQVMQRKLRSEFNSAAGNYQSKLHPASPEMSSYEVIRRISVGEFDNWRESGAREHAHKPSGISGPK